MFSGQQWACGTCTFKNNASSQKCSMCQSMRPAGGMLPGISMGGAQPQPGARLFDDLARRGQLVNGAFNWPGFSALCKQIGWDEKAAGALWRQVDADRGGSIDRREFLAFAARPDVNPYIVPFENRICGASAAPVMGQPVMGQPVMGQPVMGGNQVGVRLFDYLGRTGQVTAGSIKWPGFLALCQAIGWDQKAATSLWNQVDADKGGSIDRREFLVFAARPDVNQYLAAYENRVCPPMGQGAPAMGLAMGSPMGGATMGMPMGGTMGAALPPGQKLWNQLQSQGKIVNGSLSWNHFAPVCAQIGWTESVGRMLWNQTDVDKSGTLDNREFLMFAARPDVRPYLVPFEDKTCNAPAGVQDFGLRLFDYLDGKDGRGQRDGVISWAEFAPLCQQAGWDQSVAHMLWNDSDTDRSGTLSRSEFINFANRADVRPALMSLDSMLSSGQFGQQGQAQAQAPPGMRLFDHLDGRGAVKDGVLSWTEFAPLCAQIGWSEDIARTLWQQTDTDKSGTLSREEFLRFASRPDVKPYLVPMEEKTLMSQGAMSPHMGSPMAQGMGPMGSQYGMRQGQGPMPGYGPGAGGPAFIGQMGQQQSFHGLPPGSQGQFGAMSPHGAVGYNAQMGVPPMMGPGGQSMGGPPMGAVSPRGPVAYNPQMGGPPPMGLNGAPGGQPPSYNPPMGYGPGMGQLPMQGQSPHGQPMMGQPMGSGYPGQMGQPPMQGQYTQGAPPRY